jgi:hypothetical protein
MTKLIDKADKARDYLMKIIIGARLIDRELIT